MHKILKFGHLSVFGIFLIFLQTDTPTFILYVQVEFPFHGGHFEAHQQITPIRISSQSPRHFEAQQQITPIRINSQSPRRIPSPHRCLRGWVVRDLQLPQVWVSL
jgi:hypothetical protein